MKRRIVLVSMLFVLVCAVAFPAAAQDAPVAPAPCTADEVKQVADLAVPFGDQLNTVSTGTYADNTAKLLAWGDLYQSYFNDVYSNLPTCIDGVLYGDTVGTMLNQQMTLEAMIVLDAGQKAANTGDADVHQAMVDVSNLQGDLAKSTFSGLNSLVTQYQAGTGIPTWLPACDTSQAKFKDQQNLLDTLEQAYTDQLPALQAYLDNGTVDKTAYLAVIKLVSDMDAALKNGQASCPSLYDRTISDLYALGDTFTALTLGQAVPYMSGSASADQVNALIGYFNDSLSSNINGAAATVTPES